jgi:putative phosphoribosyl transferase
VKTTLARRDVEIFSERGPLGATLTVPDGATGLVVFAHGSGSSRLSPRNRAVAEALNARGLGTLLLDLLTAAEEREDAVTGELRFDIPFLASRLLTATSWAATDAEAQDLRVGFFGASTGAAAALVAAGLRPGPVGAVVSRGGRPDLAADLLPRVTAPTLLIVGGRDTTVLRLNEEAYARLTCPKRLEIVPGATHLFEEPGALDAVSRLAAAWFLRHLGGAKA